MGSMPPSMSLSIIVQGDVRDEQTLGRIRDEGRNILRSARQLGLYP
jgi:hypothetical protein